jgi:hypothetical protein
MRNTANLGRLRRGKGSVLRETLLALAKPDQVAADIERAVEKGRCIVYTRWHWWPIMMIVRHLPWFVFRRLKI